MDAIDINTIEYSEGTPSDIEFGPLRANRCYYMDCHAGLMILAEAIKHGAPKWDVMLTDPPYGVGFEAKSVREKINYDDDNFIGIDWLETSKDVAGRILFTPGMKNLYKYPPATWIVGWFKPGTKGRCVTGAFCNWEPLLFYQVEKGSKIYIDAVRAPLAESYVETEPLKLVHNCPKPPALYRKVLTTVTKASSVVDPFAGSGTTIQVAEELGIPWLAFEREVCYRPDIEKRIAHGMTIHGYRGKQSGLGAWFTGL